MEIHIDVELGAVIDEEEKQEKDMKNEQKWERKQLRKS